MNKQNLITEENKVFRYLQDHHKKFLFGLLLLTTAIPTLLNLFNGKPLLMGSESYFHLAGGQPFNLLNYLQNLPPSLVWLFPVLLSVTTLFVFLKVGEKAKLPLRFSLIFLAFTFISPTFMYSALTLSSYSWILFLALLGFLLMSLENRFLNNLSIIPLIGCTFFDVLSGLLITLFLLSSKFFYEKKSYLSRMLVGILVFTILFNALVLEIPIIQGPFHVEQPARDLISDLGGLSGISFFMFLMSLIGITVTWKRKRFYVAYLFLPIVTVAYVYNSGTIIFLTLVLTIFATLGFIRLFETEWKLVSLKYFTFFLLLLGLLFSSISYADRISEIGPSAGDEESLSWIRKNTSPDTVVFSGAEKSHFIHYYAQRRTPEANLTQQIFGATYISDLFPVLERNNVEIIYLTKDIRSSLPPDQGILFLLKNERFKLVHSHEGSEVWMFSNGQE